MKKGFKYLTNINFFISIIGLVSYVTIRFKLSFLRIATKGDEESFLEIFRIFINDGYFKANITGNSTVFNAVSFVFFKITANDLLSLRITSLFFGILSIVTIWFFYKKYFKIPNIYRLTAFITAANTMIIMSWILTGVNDILVSFLTILLFITIYKLKNNEHNSNTLFILFGAIVALMLSTRKMTILLYPSMAIVLFAIFLFKKYDIKKILIKGVYTSTSFVAILFVINMPSLLENGKLSFHDKAIKSSTVNWVQLQYLSSIGEEQGKLSHGKHYTLNDVEQYLKENGSASLPKTGTEAIFFDLGRTFKEFFKDLIYEIKPFTRLLGVIFIFNLFLFIWYILKRKITVVKLLNQHILVFSFIYVSIICFIVISYVETRWFSNILLLLPIVLMERLYKFKIDNKLDAKFDFIMINLQLLSLTVMSLPYLINNIGILI